MSREFVSENILLHAPIEKHSILTGGVTRTKNGKPMTLDPASRRLTVAFLAVVAVFVGHDRARAQSDNEGLDLSIELVEPVAVIRTPPGTANLVARRIDEAALPGIAGTVAGDDTIIAVLRKPGAGKALKELLTHG